MKSYIKLFGPSIDKALDALDNLIKELPRGYEYGKAISQIISIIDPSIDLMTGKMIRRGWEQLGDYDFIIEWAEIPSSKEVRSLIKRIDMALLYTGCHYTITTKE